MLDPNPQATRHFFGKKVSNPNKKLSDFNPSSNLLGFQPCLFLIVINLCNYGRKKSTFSIFGLVQIYIICILLSVSSINTFETSFFNLLENDKFKKRDSTNLDYIFEKNNLLIFQNHCLNEPAFKTRIRIN